MKMPILKNANGEKLYPVCSWENNQHKLHNACTRAENRQQENEIKKLRHLIEVFDNGERYKGIVYATWKDGQAIKDYIMAYDLRH